MKKRCLGCMEQYGAEFNICPHCGYIEGTPAEEAIHIEPGKVLLDRYIIGKVLGYGGFGVTYLAWDGKLEQKVAIKEYLPSEFSTRMPGVTQVTIFNGEKNEQFRDGLHKFVEEAKRLAKFQNESGIVKIFDSFEENDTAYIVMEYLDGETLTEYLKEHKTIAEDDAVDMLLPVMESLEVVHRAGLLHRDIAPDNIFLTKTGEVKLIDFGASRYATTSHSRSLTVIIKPGYSPEEQYRSRGDQGPYTDVYAMAATMYKMMTGKTPPDAMERRAKYENQNKDILEPPHKLVKGISINRETALLNAMNVRIEDRTPTVDAFIKELNSEKTVKRVYGKIKKLDLYRWPKWIKVSLASILCMALVFGILLLTGVIKFSSNYSKEIVVPEGVVSAPDVEGLEKDEALRIISASNLLASAEGTIESEYITPGKIILQTPVGGTYLEKNGTIVLTVSSGKAVEGAVDNISTIPYIIWDNKETAISKLRSAGLGEPLIEEVYDENVAEGCVVSTSIQAGEKVAEGTVITIQVSKGAAYFAMPDVSGLTKERAEEMLVEKGIVVAFEYAKHDSVPENNIISQSLKANSDVRRGDKVTLVVCSGAPTIAVQNVCGKAEKEAKDILEGQNFKVAVLENYSDTVPVGKVISQSPEGGTSQLKGATITIYISKGLQPVKVLFDADGGKVNTDSITVTEKYGTLPVPTRLGYTFEGWYTSKSGGVLVDANTKLAEKTTHTLYARWTANTYTITFNANGGYNLSKARVDVTFGESIGTLPTVSRQGYSFAGWYSDPVSGEQITENYILQTEGNITVYAHWSEKSYIVTFDANGGSDVSVSMYVVYGGVYSGLPTTTRSGYFFDGWFTEKTSGKQIRDGDTVDSTSDHILYARWSEASYTVTLDANGGTLSTNSINVVYGAKYGSLPTPQKIGYTFDGWYTSKTGGTLVTKDTTAGIGNTVIYAQWTAQQYTLTFNPNGGSVDTTSKMVAYGSNYGTLPTPTRAGYTFDGWYTSSSGGNKVTASTIMGDSNVTVYAHWVKETYTITFDANGGSVGTTSKTVSYGSTYGTLPTPTRDGWSFDGWYIDNVKVTESTVHNRTTNVVLRANWIARKYLVRWNTGTGYSITVKRTASPNAGATIGVLLSGDPVWTGDVLSITYAANSGYTLGACGATSITVTNRNIVAADIYGSATANKYTYSIIYRSSNGTSLGTDKITHEYNGEYVVAPKEFSGYETPLVQIVKWDSTTPKTIIFNYSPTAVVNSTKAGAFISSRPQITYSTQMEYRNRIADSVQIRFTTVVTKQANWNGFQHGIAYKATCGSVSSGIVQVSSYYELQATAACSGSASSNWITVPLNTTNQTSVSFSVYMYQNNLNGTDLSGYGYSNNSYTWTVDIPAY